MTTPVLTLAAFESGAFDPAAFDHAAHVRMAHAMLGAADFPDAARRYAGAIRALAGRVGRPEKYHQTITIAFLSLIAERMAMAPGLAYEDFAAANRDLFDRTVLTRRYSPERLASDIARTVFLLPDRAAA